MPQDPLDRAAPPVREEDKVVRVSPAPRDPSASEARRVLADPKDLQAPREPLAREEDRESVDTPVRWDRRERRVKRDRRDLRGLRERAETREPRDQRD